MEARHVDWPGPGPPSPYPRPPMCLAFFGLHRLSGLEKCTTEGAGELKIFFI